MKTTLIKRVPKGTVEESKKVVSQEETLKASCILLFPGVFLP